MKSGYKTKIEPDIMSFSKYFFHLSD